MNVALWAEIRRLHEIEKMSGRAIALRAGCSRDTVARALRLDQPPTTKRPPRAGLVGPFWAKIEALLARVPGMGRHLRRGQHPGHGLARPADASRGGVRH